MRFMPPEQLRRHEVDPAWDLWALTVIVYEMLTGSNPFAGATTAEYLGLYWVGVLLLSASIFRTRPDDGKNSSRKHSH